ncbi:MAG: hypothetical protein QM817_38820 [Archangium sp.]
MLTLLISLSLGGWGAQTPVNPTTGVVDSLGDTWSVSATGWNQNFLVAWQDYRFAGQPVVIAARVTIDGGTLDPLGVVVSNLPGARPQVATSGPLAAIVWESHEDSYLRLMRDDATFASPPILMGGRCPSVALSSSGGVVVSENGALKARRFDTGGNWVDAAPIEISPSVPWATCARVSIDSSGSRAMILWRDTTTDELLTANLSMTGTPSAPVSLGTDISSGPPLLVATGDDAWFGAAEWNAMPTGTSIAGFMLSTSSPAVNLSMLPNDAWLQLEATKCDRGVCFAAVRDATTTTLDFGIVPLDGGAPLIATSQTVSNADLALGATLDGTHLALAASDYSGTEVVIGRTDFVQATPMLRLTRSRPAQSEPDVAVLGDVALVTWIDTDETTGDNVVLGKRYDSNGMPLDAVPQKLIVPAGEQLSEVEVMTGNGEWVVGASSWGYESSWLVHVSSAGVAGTQTKLNARGMHGGFVLAGTDVLLTLKQYQTMWWDPVLVTIDATGMETTTRLQDNAPKEHFTDVAITGSGERLAVWQDVDPLAGVDAIVAGKRMSSSGALLDADAIRFTPPGTAEALEPQIVGDGVTGYFLVFHSYRQAWAMHLEGTTSSAPIALLDAPLQYDAPAHLNLVQSGKHALVSFSNPSDGGVMVRELAFESGNLSATPREPLSSDGFQAWPALAVGRTAVFATWARADFSRNAMQVFVRTWQREADGASCTAGWQCLSGQCSGTCVAPPDAGTVTMGPDGGTVQPMSDGGTSGSEQPGNTERRQLSLGFSCATVDGLSMWMISVALFAWRRGRRR